MIVNPFRMNDWEIKKFLIVVLAIQLAMLGLVGLEALGFDIPILRQIIGFIFLTFIPGIVILRALKLHRLGSIETLLYSVGLSLAFLMFLGFFMNLAYPHIVIDRPISILPLISTITIVLLILCFVAYKRDKDFSTVSQFDWHKILSPPALFLILLPLLAILGTQMVNAYHSNALLLIVIPLIALVAILITFTKFIPHGLYPAAVVAIALALLYHYSLISNYLTGFDIHTEYHLANLVILNSFWDSGISQNINAMPSITILSPIYSDICRMSLTWVFKIVYPLIYSLVPLGIYQVCHKQANGKVAFLAAFFYMSVGVFYVVMPSVARGEMGLLFLVLMMLLITDKAMSPLIKSLFSMVFATSMILSHYAIAYIFIGCLIIVLPILFLSKRIFSQASSKGLPKKGGLSGQRRSNGTASNDTARNRIARPAFIVFCIVVALSWYIYQAGGWPFTSVVRVVSDIGSNIADIFNPASSEALWIILTPLVSPLHEARKYLHLFIQFLIAMGILDLFLHWRQKRFNEQYSAFSLVNFALLVAAIILPYLSIAMLTTRLYHITLMFLAPFCITGAIAICRFLPGKALKMERIPLKVASLLLVALLLFDTGFLFEVSNDHPNSVPLSLDSIAKYGDEDAIWLAYSIYTPEQEVFSARWLSERSNDDDRVYINSAHQGEVHALISYGMIPQRRLIELTPSTKQLTGANYVYLGYVNTVFRLGSTTEWIAGGGTVRGVKRAEHHTFSLDELSPLLAKTSKIYSNGGSEILLISQ